MAPLQMNSVKFMHNKTVVTRKVLVEEARESEKKSVTLRGENGGNAASAISAGDSVPNKPH